MDNQNLLQLASKLILASTTGDEKQLKLISDELAAELKKFNKENTENNSALNKDIVGFLKFNNKEISKMPKSFRHTFRAEGQTICYRKRKRGVRSCSYEARYRRHGYNISISATNLEALKQRFIEALHAAENKSLMPDVPTTFQEFTKYYFENFRIRKVRANTYAHNLRIFKNHIIPYFGSMPMKSITPAHCQKLIDSFIQKNQGRTAEEIHTLLNVTLKMAIAHGIITRNPLDIVVMEKHKRVHGKVLSIEEEKLLLEKTSGTRYQILFAVALYTGIRPNEYRTARIENNFIIAVNSKRKTKDVEYKRIPITPMLEPYLQGVTELNFTTLEHMRNKYKEILPNHTLKDMRKTFNSHCEESGIVTMARKFFMGHKLNELEEAYTELSDEFLLKEGAKFKY